MKPRISVLRRMTASVAALLLVSALVGFGSPVASAAEKSTPAWQEAIAALPVPGQGCFTASFPAIQWQSTACSSVHPEVPQQFAGPGHNQEGAGVPQQVAGCAGNSCDFRGPDGQSNDSGGGVVPQPHLCFLTVRIRPIRERRRRREQYLLSPAQHQLQLAGDIVVQHGIGAERLHRLATVRLR